ncbi:membrane protein [Gordonia Phage Odesza]|uniref:Membrane protein n=5 Tax=Tanisvirus tanis TaxID=2844677 RepID=A0A7D5JFB9_9CAUD|nr:membrane protein [Gordonia phage Tanis]AVO25321.1 hypothetical protein PBI_GRAVY_82 [Gordonia phage Gravy]AVO25414.1 hypothetical protein PBI_KERRY_82 [Gordonia phage Kerry]QGJ89691.1 membrane protein [Gordonia Phage Odesza]QKY78752.1 hypothetical protein SEA_GILL_83 [Gordonia phage Gill]QLF83798.1 membrane protein [Gordonia phage Magel]QYW00720.1 membrane protein [Gordonia phage Roney]
MQYVVDLERVRDIAVAIPCAAIFTVTCLPFLIVVVARDEYKHGVRKRQKEQR